MVSKLSKPHFLFPCRESCSPVDSTHHFSRANVLCIMILVDLGPENGKITAPLSFAVSGANEWRLDAIKAEG